MHHWPERDMAPGPFHTMRGHSTESAHILFLRVPASNVSIVFYVTLQQYQGKKVDSLGVPTLKGYIVLYTIRADDGRQSWVPGNAHMQRFYYVLHALERSSG